MKKNKWQTVTLLLLLVIAAVFLSGKMNYHNETGHLCLNVRDAYTLQPIENAYIALPESGHSTLTDENGTAVFNGIPINREIMHKQMPTPDYGTATILVYAENYLPFALFHAQVIPGKMRKGPNIYLFPNNTEEGLKVVSMIESPPDEYVQTLLEQYKP